MNNRLQQFLNAENISQSQFADSIGVARASISHILAGRNKPGYDFIARMAGRYPNLNLEWLITGRGKIYKTADQFRETTAKEVVQEEITAASPPELPLFTEENAPDKQEYLPENDIKQEKTPLARSIKKVVVFYNDGTYEEIS